MSNLVIDQTRIVADCLRTVRRLLVLYADCRQLSPTILVLSIAVKSTHSEPPYIIHIVAVIVLVSRSVERNQSN